MLNVLKKRPAEMIPWDGLLAYFVASGWFFSTIRYLKTKPASLGWKLTQDFCNPAKIDKISTPGALRWLIILGGLRQIRWHYSQIETWLADVKVQHKAAIKSYDFYRAHRAPRQDSYNTTGVYYYIRKTCTNCNLCHSLWSLTINSINPKALGNTTW